MIENVVIIGAGNLATQLSLALTGMGIQVRQVYSRTLEAAGELAAKVNAEFTHDLAALMPGCDLYIVAVKDSAIQEVMVNLPLGKDCLIVHTAGSIPMDVLSCATNNYGVFYPLQSFSKYRDVDFSDIPICIEARQSDTLLKLQQLASRLSSSVHPINSQERKTLHLAGVFVNNFVNHFYAIGYEILQEKKLDFNLLKPLIRETAHKIESMNPLEAQTGPAKRNDQGVINEQLNMLEDRPEFQKIYNFVSQSITHIHQRQNDDLL